MAVLFDAATSLTPVTTPVNISQSHTPSGTPRAVIAFIVSNQNDPVSGTPTYGGVAMSEVSGSPNVLGSGETAGVCVWFLGSSIPTGTQTFAATNGSGDTIWGAVITLTASSDTEIVDSDGTINSTSQTDPSVTLSLGGRTCWAGIGFGSGHDAVGSITPLTSWTPLENDFGLMVGGVYRYDTIGSSDVTAGWTQAAEDAVAIAVAVSEVAAATAFRRTLSDLGTRSGSRQMVET